MMTDLGHWAVGLEGLLSDCPVRTDARAPPLVAMSAKGDVPELRL
jgi:hypothetical protein